MSGRKRAVIDVEIWRRNLRETAVDDDESCMRWFNNYFAFWVVCETKACKRANRCAGDPKSCHARIWPHVPQRMKFELQVMLKAIHERLPLAGVMQRVKQEMARFDETTRVLERLGSATPARESQPGRA
jgi:hypothetical protein